MEHLTIANFKYGLDTRRSELTSQPGTLVTAENGHINQGAQFEKRKAFVLLGTLPAGTFGLQETPNGLVTFGSAASAVIPAGLLGLVTYQRLRHYLWELDTTAPAIQTHLNPDNASPAWEPVMTGITHSCTFGGKPFAVASFGIEQSGGLGAFDDQLPITLSYYNGSCLVSSFQGLLPFSNSADNSGGAANYWSAYLFVYVAQYYLSPDFQAGFGAAADVSMNLIGPITATFAVTVSDTIGGQIQTQLFTSPTVPINAIGAYTTLYLTAGANGSFDTMVAPNVVNGALSGTVNLLPNGAVPYNTSLLQTAMDVATKVNASGTGYSAQANLITTTVAALTITAPTDFGALPNAGNVSISTTTIKTNTTSDKGSGAAGAKNYILGHGVTASAGLAQVQRVIFGAQQLAQGTYVADLVFNNTFTSLGAGYLTRKRPTFQFFLISGAAGSVNSITLPDGTNLLSAAVPYNTSLQQTAQDIQSNINTKWGGAGLTPAHPTSWAAYWIKVNGVNGIAVQGPTTSGETLNGKNNIIITCTTIKVGAGSQDGGVTNLTTSIDGGNVDPTYATSLGGKLYLARGSKINFCASYDASRWEQQDIGAGFIQNTDQDTAPTGTVSLCPYQGKLAAFSRRNISIWNVNADPAQYSIAQNLKNIGTMAALSVQAIGELDTLFLSDTGIRSLRTRDTTLNAYVVDVGSPIDDLIQTALFSGNGPSACSVVEPSSNRYWLYLDGSIYVMSYFPSLKIIAWSTYKPTYITNLGSPNSASFTYNNLTIGTKYYVVPSPDLASLSDGAGHVVFLDADGGFVAATNELVVDVDIGGDFAATVLYEATQFIPSKFLVYDGQVYVYTTDRRVLVYGGADNNTYDGSIATIELPWLDAKSPFVIKQGEAVNVAMTGKWNVYCSLDPRGNSLVQVVPNAATGTGNEQLDSTFDEGEFGFSQQGTHYKFKAQTTIDWLQPASMSSFTLQYSKGQNE